MKFVAAYGAECAECAGHAECVEVLMEFGANLMSQTPDGTSPLAVAAERGSFTHSPITHGVHSWAHSLMGSLAKRHTGNPSSR